MYERSYRVEHMQVNEMYRDFQSTGVLLCYLSIDSLATLLFECCRIVRNKEIVKEDGDLESFETENKTSHGRAARTISTVPNI